MCPFGTLRGNRLTKYVGDDDPVALTIVLEEIWRGHSSAGTAQGTENTEQLER